MKVKAAAKVKAAPLPALMGTAKNLDRINEASLCGLLRLLHVDTEGLSKRKLVETLAALLEADDSNRNSDESDADDDDEEADDDE